MFRPSSACQRNAIEMAFCWRTDDGPLCVVFGWSLPPSGSAHVTVAKSLGVRHGESCQAWPCAWYKVPIFLYVNTIVIVYKCRVVMFLYMSNDASLRMGCLSSSNCMWTLLSLCINILYSCSYIWALMCSSVWGVCHVASVCEHCCHCVLMSCSHVPIYEQWCMPPYWVFFM